MFYNDILINIDNLAPTGYSFDRIISSKYSKFLPLFALNVNKPLGNGEFISWLKIASSPSSQQTKNFEFIKTMMHTSASVSRQDIIAKTNGIITFYIPHMHTLLKYNKELFNSAERCHPVMIFSLAAPSLRQTHDRDLVLLVRKDVKIKKEYDLFVTKLVKWYGTQVEILYVDSVEEYVYMNPLDIFKGFEEESFNEKIQGVLFGPPQERTCS